MVNLGHHESPNNWYVNLGAHYISLGVRSSSRLDDETLSDTYNTPNVINEMIGIDRVQPYGDPVRHGQFLSRRLKFHTVSVCTETVIDANGQQ